MIHSGSFGWNDVKVVFGITSAKSGLLVKYTITVEQSIISAVRVKSHSSIFTSLILGSGSLPSTIQHTQLKKNLCMVYIQPNASVRNFILIQIYPYLPLH